MLIHLFLVFKLMLGINIECVEVCIIKLLFVSCETTAVYEIHATGWL